MNDALHIMIGGKNSFCNYFSELIPGIAEGKITVSANEDFRLLLINAKMHRPHALILQDNFNDTDVLINEIKQICNETKVILFTPRNKKEIQNAEFVFPLKIPEDIPGKIAEILTGKTNGKNHPVIKEVTDWSVFYLIDFEIFEGLIAEKTSKEIAEDRQREKCTIDTERNHLYNKAEVKHIVFLVLWGVKNKLINEDGKLTPLFFELKRKAL